MPQPERGRTPAGFRTQLLQRLRNETLRTGIPAQRLQQRIAFERLLARLPHDGEWVLKGAPGGALRVRVVSRVAGLEFVTFHLDLSSGDALVDPPDLLCGSDLLQFAGIAPVEFPVYPVPQHLAEKLHAYTLPRGQENTRVRDLVDLVIMAAAEQVEADRLFRSVEATFAVRGTHPILQRLPEPPASWAQPFANIAAEAVNLPTTDLREGHALAAQFWDPFLADRAVRQLWLPDQRRWSASP